MNLNSPISQNRAKLRKFFDICKYFSHFFLFLRIYFVFRFFWVHNPLLNLKKSIMNRTLLRGYFSVTSRLPPAYKKRGDNGVITGWLLCGYLVISYTSRHCNSLNSSFLLLPAMNLCLSGTRCCSTALSPFVSFGST